MWHKCSRQKGNQTFRELLPRVFLHRQIVAASLDSHKLSLRKVLLDFMGLLVWHAIVIVTLHSIAKQVLGIMEHSQHVRVQ
jgi:hypothetical protein